MSQSLCDVDTARMLVRSLFWFEESIIIIMAAAIAVIAAAEYERANKKATQILDSSLSLREKSPTTRHTNCR